jgi:hypothetical protein
MKTDTTHRHAAAGRGRAHMISVVCPLEAVLIGEARSDFLQKNTRIKKLSNIRANQQQQPFLTLPLT